MLPLPRVPMLPSAAVAATSGLHSNHFLQAAGLLPDASSPNAPSASSLRLGTTSAPAAAAASTTPTVCRDPLCRDLTCPTSIRSHHLLTSSAAAAAAACRSFSLGCSSYSTAFMMHHHHREAMMAAVAAAATAAVTNPASPVQPSSSPGSSGGPLPYVCNWVAGSTFTSTAYIDCPRIVEVRISSDERESTFKVPTTVAADLPAVKTY